METFLDLIDRFDGASVPAPSTLTAEPGFANVARSRRNDARYQRALVECAKLIDGARRDRTMRFRLEESMSTSDFPLLFGDILDRQMLGMYADIVPTFGNYMRVGTVNDFRPAYRYDVTGGDGMLLPVAELAEYKSTNLSENRWPISVAKYGRVLPISLEMLINDDMGAFDSIPARFARAARRTEARKATELYVAASGPNPTIYSNANKNLVTVAAGADVNNPVLSVAGLTSALNLLMQKRDSQGEPIVITMAHLVIPPELAMQADQILNATEFLIPASGANPEVRTGNYLKGRLRVSIDPYASVINTTSGKTAWYLFADPGDRPAVEFARLRGYEQPQLFMKASDAVRIGGTGMTDPRDGDFVHDGIVYKVRHFCGGAALDVNMTVASKGTGAA